MHPSQRVRVCVTCFLLLTSCADVTVVVGGFGASGDAGRANAGAGGQPSASFSDAGPTLQDAGSQTPTRPVVETGNLQQFCSGRGAPIHMPLANRPEPTCAGRMERALFSYGLCACGGLRSEGASLALDSFDSRQGQYAAGQNAAAIGVNETWNASAPSIQTGTAIVANTASVSTLGFLVAGDFKVGAGIAATSSGMRIARDLWSAADVTAPAARAIAVARDAYLPPGRSGADKLAVGAAIQTRDFSVPAPCACDLDVAELVAQARTTNDNTAPGISSFMSGLSLATAAVALPCGRILFSGDTKLLSTLVLTAAARTALFFDGNLEITGTVGFDPGTTGEIDMFVADNLNITGAAAFGNTQRPYAMRLYVGGTISVSLLTMTALQMYAPHAAIQLSGLTDFYGSQVAHDVITTGIQRMHFDRAILDTSNGCSEPAPAVCDACDQCSAGLGCVGGSCGACTRDADCCEPMVCSNGVCQPLSLPLP